MSSFGKQNRLTNIDYHFQRTKVINRLFSDHTEILSGHSDIPSSIFSENPLALSPWIILWILPLFNYSEIFSRIFHMNSFWNIPRDFLGIFTEAYLGLSTGIPTGIHSGMGLQITSEILPENLTRISLNSKKSEWTFLWIPPTVSQEVLKVFILEFFKNSLSIHPWGLRTTTSWLKERFYWRFLKKLLQRLFQKSLFGFLLKFLLGIF